MNDLHDLKHNPAREVRQKTEDNARTRFLSDDELPRLMAAAKASKWGRLHLLVHMLQLYGQRWGIETSFRDIKDYKFGMGMGDVHISNPVRRDRLFLFSALAIVLLTLLGKAGDSVGLERTIKVNTSKSRGFDPIGPDTFSRLGL